MVRNSLTTNFEADLNNCPVDSFYLPVAYLGESSADPVQDKALSFVFQSLQLSNCLPPVLPQEIEELDYENFPKCSEWVLIQTLQKTQEPETQAIIWCELGIVTRLKGETPSSLEYFDKAERFARENYDPQLLCQVLGHKVDTLLQAWLAQVDNIVFINSHGSGTIQKDSLVSGMYSNADRLRNLVWENAVEAYTLAKLLGREDLNWLAVKLAKVAVTTDLSKLTNIATELTMDKRPDKKAKGVVKHIGGRLKI